jgi:hypothetical protein
MVFKRALKIIKRKKPSLKNKKRLIMIFWVIEYFKLYLINMNNINKLLIIIKCFWHLSESNHSPLQDNITKLT